MRKRIGAVWLGLLAAVVLVVACESTGGPVTVTGTGKTREPASGAYPTPTPEWYTPRPVPPPTLPPSGTLPTPGPK